jgi:hypothetical protein
MSVFWDVVPCKVVEVEWRFGGGQGSKKTNFLVSAMLSSYRD